MFHGIMMVVCFIGTMASIADSVFAFKGGLQQEGFAWILVTALNALLCFINHAKWSEYLKKEDSPHAQLPR